MDREIGLYAPEDSELIDELCKITGVIAPKLPYHNAQHMREVASMCERYALEEGLGYKGMRRLRKAGELHDIIYIPGRDDNEELAAETSRNILIGLGDDGEEIEYVSRLILATKLSSYPRETDEMIIRDADIDNLGRDDFFEKTELLRQEECAEPGEWYIGNMKFLGSIKYFTRSAQKLRGPRLRENLEQVRRLVLHDRHLHDGSEGAAE